MIAKIASLLLCAALPSLSASTGHRYNAVVRSFETGSGELLEISAGGAVGLRLGMRCNVVREDVVIANVVVVDLRPFVSTGLIDGSSAQTLFRSGELLKIVACGV